MAHSWLSRTFVALARARSSSKATAPTLGGGGADTTARRVTGRESGAGAPSWASVDTRDGCPGLDAPTSGRSVIAPPRLRFRALARPRDLAERCRWALTRLAHVYRCHYPYKGGE